MANIHLSEHKYRFLQKYDVLLLSRKNRYTMLFLFFYKDYFIYKILNKLMVDGNKYVAIAILRASLLQLKNYLGFQPFFIFKHVSFRMRQLFKVQKTIVGYKDRESKEYYMPFLLKPHNQITYGINHLVACAKQIALEEHMPMPNAMSIVLLNSFVYTTTSL
jgi:ribosomal protein S7